MKHNFKEPHFSAQDLSARWHVPITTLSQWRWNGKGPLFLKMGRHVIYRLEDVEIFEKQCLRRDTTCTGYTLTPSEYNKIAKEQTVTPPL